MTSPPRVLRLGWTPVRGTRWLGEPQLNLDAGGVTGDRTWSAVDGRLDAVRVAAHPTMMRIVVDAAGLPACVDDPLVDVTYWGRTVPARIASGPSIAGLSGALREAIGFPVRLARTDRRPGFVYGAPVSLVTTTALEGLPHDAHRDLDRYRANVVVDDVAQPLPLRIGARVQVGAVWLRVVEAIERCVVIDHDPVTGCRDQRLLPRLGSGVLLGWGCEVDSPGRVRVGDAVRVR